MPVKKNFSMICAWSILVVYIFVSGCNSIKKTDLILTKTPTIETRTTKDSNTHSNNHQFASNPD